MGSHRFAWERFSRTALLSAAAVAVLLIACSCQQDDAGPVASIRIGTTASEVNLLILIAEAQGYFASNGLNVNHQIYPSGVAAINGLLNGEVEIATGSEFAFAGEVLSHRDIRTIGAINRSSIEYLVGRVDRGIHSIADLEGKTIGVPLESRPQFALDRFLYFQGIEASGVTLVDVAVDQSVDALVSGQVDAVAAWQPYIDRIKERMGHEVVAWSVQEEQPSYTLLMCETAWAAENPDVAARLLQSLVRAESYVADHPDAAKAFLQERLNYDAEYMASVWPDYRFSVLLDQALVVAMEDQARWIIENHLTDEVETPNFVRYIYFDGLETVNPDAVTIIR